MRPTLGLRLLAATVGGILVVVGQVVAFIGLFFLSTGGAAFTWKADYAAGFVFEALALAACLGGFLVAAKISCNARPVRATLLAFGVLLVGVVLMIVGQSVAFDFLGTLAALAVAIFAGARGEGRDGLAGQYPTPTR
jgi:membrane protease YdiL (CAAX protease family)